MERPSQEMELYTIPSYSSWFSWNNIHEVEKFSLREFFDGSSVTRSPRIYKEYRDFIISKYRENPSRKLTFTEVRKSLIGDVSVLLKVFTFLEKWGLINFTGDNDGGISHEVKPTSFDEREEENWRVKVEEGAPHGVRVVAAPNSMKPVVVPPDQLAAEGIGGIEFRWPQLASYSDVYEGKKKKGGLTCRSCKEDCEGACYEDIKDESFFLCEKCFKSGSHDKSKSPDDFKLKDIKSPTAVWTEAETLLLLESVIKHGDNWDLIAASVQTKSKRDCISKLIQLPFGDLMLGAAQNYLSPDITGLVGNSEQENNNDLQEPVKAEEVSPVVENKEDLHKEADDEGPPQKKLCSRPTSDMGNSLMKQVARISTMLGPHISASAAEAAIAALCYENQCSKDVFDDDESFFNPKESPETNEHEGAAEVNDAVDYENHNLSENGDSLPPMKSIIPINLRARAATATALGAAAANAKLLADQEEREIGLLVATIIEAQLKKLHCKMKYVDDLKLIMEKEEAQYLNLEESLTKERINILRRVFSAAVAQQVYPNQKGLSSSE